MHPVNMEMDNVKLGGPLSETLQEIVCAIIGSTRGLPSRSADGHTGTRRALLSESPLANSVTLWPSATRSSVSQDTTLSVPPYNFGGTLSANGAIWAIRIP
jgi:hypothetical protein